MFSARLTAIQRVAQAQAGITLLAALLSGAMAGAGAGLALLFGGLAALAVNLVLVWRERQSIRHPEWDQHRLFKLFIRVGVERLALLVTLLGLGLWGLKLQALPMLSGLVLAQFAWLLAADSGKAK
jgi:ATP synthase protein I